MSNGHGQVSVWLAVLGYLFAAVSALLTLLYRRSRGEIKAIHEEVRRLAREAARFDRYVIAADVTEKVRGEQRVELVSEVKAIDKRIRDLLQADADWKHKRLQPRLNRLLLEVIRIKDKIGMPHDFDDESAN